NLNLLLLIYLGITFLSLIIDAEIHLEAMNLGETIKEENNTSLQDRAKAMIFIRQYLHKVLKVENLNIKERYDHQKFNVLPQACYNWLHLRLQDFKLISEYNSVFFLITS
ncbi:hypothetical protein POPTR_014G097450v4, partial [Populus trichocarpa]